MRRLVVGLHRPWLMYVMSALFIVIAALVYYAVEQRARIAALKVETGYQAAVAGQAHTERELADAQALMESQRENIARLERRRQVDVKVYREVDLEIRRMQDRIFALREEVMFYRRIVSVDRGRELKIQALSIEPEGVGRRYRFELVLIRTINNDKATEGTVVLAISGDQDGRPTELSHASVTESGDDSIEFDFKYFQRLEGWLTLPSGFAPQRVLVKANTTSKKFPRVEESFEWPGTG